MNSANSLYLLIVIFFFTCNQKANCLLNHNAATATVTIELLGFKKSKDITIKSKLDLNVTSKENGFFKKEIILNEPSILKIEVGKNQNFDLYVKPGDDLYVKVNEQDFINFNKITFIKGNIKENETINKLRSLLIYDKVLNYSFYNTTLEAFVEELKALNIETENILSTINKHELSVEYLQHLDIYINSALALYYENYPVVLENNFAKSINRNLPISRYKKRLDTYNSELLLNNSKFLRLIEKTAFDKARSHFKEKYPNKSLFSELYIHAFFEIAADLEYNKIIQDYLNFTALKGAAFFGYDLSDSTDELYLATAPSSHYEKQWRELYIELNAAKDIDIFEYEFYNKNGEVVTLEQHRGAYIYIDFWASWCGPCKILDPDFKSIKRKLSKEKQSKIVLVKISLDKAEYKDEWLSDVNAQENLVSNYLVMNGFESEICKDLKISAIPRFLLVHPDGSYENYLSPGEEDIIEDLEKLLK